METFFKWELYVTFFMNVLAAVMEQGLVPAAGPWHTAAVITLMAMANFLALFGRQLAGKYAKKK